MMSPYVQTRFVCAAILKCFSQILTNLVPTNRYYRAPELVLDWKSYSSIVDVWSIGCIMGELITGQVLFPGANSIDQWERIVDLLGTPDQSFISQLSENVRDYIQKRPKAGKDFKMIFPDDLFAAFNKSRNKQNDLARDLLSRILVIDPKKRITVEQALRHDYLKIWRKEEDFKHPLVPNLNELIGKDYTSIADWQELIKDKEIKHYNFYY